VKQKYGAILADPPWHWKAWSAKGEDRATSNHYGVMSMSDLIELPVHKLAADDCVLFMWAIDPLLDKAFEVLKAWKFTYKTVGFYWVKANRKADTPFVGLGKWTRANPEQCLLATRGSPKRLARDVQRLIVSPVREHSRKPEEVRDGIERLVAGPYMELFARDRRDGWDAIGDEL
jgi:N6-adenosine-specific RNA methylase IME4